jgi:diguanylate cyclase (GGDEF)-like protein
LKIGGSSSLQQAVLDALPDSLFLLDNSTGTVAALNAASLAMLGEKLPRSIATREILPELNPLDLAGATSDSPLIETTLVAQGCRKQVLLRHFALPSIGDEAETSGQLIIVIAGEIGDTALGHNAPQRDAIDDSFHDPLTRLPNRRLFQRRLERALERAGRADYHFALLFVDLDRFKSINDRFGHLRGDDVLIAAAHRLVEAVRPQDMVARRDGDEFTILLDDLPRLDDVPQIAQRIIEHVQLPLELDGHPFSEGSISASVGVITVRDQQRSATELIALADAAMYRAKAQGGGTFVFHDEQPSEMLGHAHQKPLPR